MASRLWTSSRSDPLSARSNRFPLACPVPRTACPSPQQLTVFPFRVPIHFLSPTFGTQRFCYVQRATSFLNASLQMGVSLQLPTGTLYLSGNIIPVITPCVGNSSVRACTILFFDSRQLRHHQSCAIPRTFSRCCVYMNFPLPSRPFVISMWDSLALALTLQLPTRWKAQ